MLNTTSVDAVDSSVFDGIFRKPLYATYNFARIPDTIETVLTGREWDANNLPRDVLGHLPARYEKVVLVFLDAFGWESLMRHSERHQFLRRTYADGVVSKLTSQFPSTTAVHATTIHTGQDVGTSGVYEWFHYEPTIDSIIAPLLFSFAGDKERDTLRNTGVEPRSLFPNDTFYQRLGKHGIRTHIYQSGAFTPSTFGEVVFQGVSAVHRFVDVREGIRCLVDNLQREGPAYHFLYADSVDAAAHTFGPGSKEHDESVSSFFASLEEALLTSGTGRSSRTLLLLTADHGQEAINPETTCYLDTEAPEILQWIKQNRQGVPIAPAGSSRDQFLHIREEHVERAMMLLRSLLAGTASVYLVDDLLADGFFGPNPGPRLRSRIGNVCVLPHAHQSVWWRGGGRFVQKFRGQHGGLLPSEMEIPLLALPL